MEIVEGLGVCIIGCRLAEDEVEKEEKSKMLVRCQAQEIRRMVISSTAWRNLGELVWGESWYDTPNYII